MNNESLSLNIIKILFALVLLYVGYLTATGAEPYYLYNADLAFHEGGHTIFFFFGEFVQFLGGTLMQILLPSFFAAYFFFNRAAYSASVSAWWLGVNLYEIGTYAADAQA